jgi:hypothetical protein
MTGLPAQVVSMAVAAGAAFGAAAFSVLTLWRAKSLLRSAEQNAAAAATRADDAIGILQQKVGDLCQEIAEVRRNAATIPVATVRRAGLNLEKRSQALRMHRRGEQPAEIAAALEIPLQEVNLLLKVHRIVLSTI